MKIIIIGNLGYVGPNVSNLFRKSYPEAELIGFDIGYFAKHLTNTSIMPEAYLNHQHFGDVRNFPEKLLNGVDTIINLAAISNDPIGNKFEKVTMEINYEANIKIAEKAKKAGVKNFVFASSCSVYGSAEDTSRTETSALNPLTAYAKSKVRSEEALRSIASDTFKITCFRFATACGMSDRLRLDLVLNDFVAGALTSKSINILSDGTPWRPLINVSDMARAISWGHERKSSNGGNFLVVNTGSNNWNYQIKELAYAIKDILPNVNVSINKDALPDKRSYRVNFDLFRKLAPNHQPLFDLKATVMGLINGLNAIGFDNKDFRNSSLMRLNVINNLIEQGTIDNDLNLIAMENAL